MSIYDEISSQLDDISYLRTDIKLVMGAFRDAFSPMTEEQDQYTKNLFKRLKDEFLAYGFTEEEYELCEELEIMESIETPYGYSWSSRLSLLRNGIITVDEVKSDLTGFKIEKWGSVK